MNFRISLLLFSLLLACGDTSSDPRTIELANSNVFVGTVGADEGLIAIVKGDGHLVAYACGFEDNFSTHTGWFFGLRDENNLQLVNSNNNLRVEGTLDDEEASGTLTLADGRIVNWTAEPARGQAGLFDFEDDAQLIGFIRDNDGRTAGNSVLRVGTGVATGPNTPISSPVTPAPSGTTTTTPSGTITTSNESLIVGVPSTGSSTKFVPLNPIQQADKRVITRSGPVVVFLAHGMSDNIGTPVEGDQEDPVACSGPRDTPFYGRCEWGPDFLPGLFGTNNINAQLFNLAGQNVSGDAFVNNPSNRMEFDETMGLTMDGECAKNPDDPKTLDPKTAQHFIVPRLHTSKAPPPLAAFVTWRDSTRGLVTSGRRLTRQVFAALLWYENTYGIAPGVIFVSQSFGGLASRFLLSVPNPSSLVDKLNVEKTKICKEDLAKMNYIRDRTLYLLTLATPHEGSYLAEAGIPAKTFIQSLADELASGIAQSPLGRVYAALRTLSTLVGIQILNVEELARDASLALVALFDTPALEDLQLDSMSAFNQGPLSPEHMRRSANSPIVGAEKVLIPVYATLGRSPGSDVFDRPGLLESLENYSDKRPKAQGWITGTMGVDSAIRGVLSRGFGDASVPPYTGFEDVLDRRARLFDTSPTTEEFAIAFEDDIESVMAAVSPWFVGQFGDDASALVSVLNGDVTLTIPAVSFPIHVDQKWTIGFDGSTLEVPIPALECSGLQIPLDDQVLATLLVQTFESTPLVLEAIQGADLNAILTTLGIGVEASSAVAQSIANWFVARLGQLSNLPDNCDALPGSPFDVFSLAELGNWRVVATTTEIPRPVWIPTGEPVSDGEMDNDGAVHSASALGFTLARQPFYFEHDRMDAPNGQFGSWYRLYDNPETEKFHHGLQYENSVGFWVFKTFLAAGVGPIPRSDQFSAWPE